MKKAVFLLILLLLLPCAALAETKLMVVSDLHYMAPSLYTQEGLFIQLLQNGDGKMPQQGEALLAALYREVLAQRPDALVGTGDLTFNGERASHEALAEWFHTVEAAGVPVWVIPGNHDINTAPAGFTEYSYYPTESVTPEDFAAIYADFLLPGEAGFSYAVPVGDVVLAMTDVAWYEQQAQTYGLFTARHADWLERTLGQAGDKTVVTATHHSLLPHTRFAQENFLMFGHETMAALCRQYGVGLNLSGHLHIQHIAREEGLTDAALGAFCVWPHRYAVVTRTEDALTYDAQSLHAAYLPQGFLESSREWFADCTRRKVKASGLTGTKTETDAMADYAARFNLAYFSGAYDSRHPASTQDAACALSESQGETGFWQYMKMVMRENTGDNLAEIIKFGH